MFISFAEALEQVVKIHGYGEASACFLPSAPPFLNNLYAPPSPPALLGSAICAGLVLAIGSLPFTKWDDRGGVPLANEWMFSIMLWLSNFFVNTTIGFVSRRFLRREHKQAPAQAPN